MDSTPQDPQSFYNAAVAKGYDGNKVKQYMQSQGFNTDLIDISGNSAPVSFGTGATTPQTAAPAPAATTPQTVPTTSAPTTKTPMPSIKKKGSPGGFAGTVEDWLPTIGGIAGGITGGIVGTPADVVSGPGGTVIGAAGGAALGASGGEALKEKLQNNELDPWGILGQGALAGGGELIGGPLGMAAGKVIAKVGGKMLPKIGAGTFAKTVADQSTGYGPAIAKAKAVAQKYGLLNLTPQDAVNKMPEVMDTIHNGISDALQSAAPVSKAQALAAFTKKLANDAGTYSQDEYQKAIGDITGRIHSLGNTGNSGLLDAAGKPIESPNSTVSAQDVYNLKQKLGDELSSTFSQIRRGTTPSKANEIKLHAWNAMKDVLDNVDQAGSNTIRNLNDEQHQMMGVLGPGIVDAAQAAVKPGGFMRKVIAGVAGNAAATAANVPIPGAGIAAGYLGEQALENPQTIVNAGKAIAGSKGAQIAGGVGNAIGTTVGHFLPPIGAGNNSAQYEGDNNGNNSHTDGIIPPTLANYKPDSQGHFSLQPLSTATVLNIPGPYLDDTQYNQLVQSNPAKYMKGTPVGDAAALAHQTYKDAADRYITNNKLTDGERETLRNVPQTIAAINSATDLANNASILNKVATINDLKKIDSTEYAKFAAYTKYLASAVGKMNQGGVLRSYDISSMGDVMPSTEDSPAQYLGKLQALGAITSAVYHDKQPLYNLTYGSQPAGVQTQPLQ